MPRRQYFCKLRQTHSKSDRNMSVKVPNSGSLGIPILNSDGKSYTPTFCLKQDLEELPHREQKLKISHQQKIDEHQSNHSAILVPQPKRKHKHCSVCHQKYQDYRHHINLAQHHQRISTSKYQPYIKELIQKLNSKPQDEIDTIQQSYHPPPRKILRLANPQ